MPLNWPRSLHSCVSEDWDLSDVVAEIWDKESDSRYVYCKSTLVFSEFSSLSAQLAKLLRPISPNLIGILCHPNHLTPILVHGILCSGCAFLPLSARSDFSRLRDLLCGVVSTLNLEDPDFKRFQVGPIQIYLRVNQTQQLPPSDLAYCVTTSGSTGTPKLVLASHSCVSANVIDLCGRVSLGTPSKSLLITSPLTFDASIVQLYLALLTRRRIVFPSESVSFGVDGNILANLIKTASVNVWQCTSSVFNRLQPTDLRDVGDLTVFLGGEPCSLDRIPEDLPNVRFYFVYGLTEVSAWSSIISACDVRSETAPLPGATPIGQPMAHSRVILRDVDADSGIGQVYISRSGGGYAILQSSSTQVDLRAALTRLHEQTLVPTGDYAIAGLAGSSSPLWFLGRRDRMIKVFGHKVHLECLECQVLSLLTSRLKSVSSGIRVVNCQCSPNPLTAVVQLEGTDDLLIDFEELKQWTLQHLESPIDPLIIFSFDPLRLNRNGKLCTTKSIRSICLAGLSMSKPDLNLTFLELGGSSLGALYLVQNLICEWPVLKAKKDLLLAKMFSHTYGKLIEALEKEALAPDTSEEVVNSSLEPPDKRPRIEPSPPTRSSLAPMMRVNWSCLLGRCVDASPLVDKASESLFIGSHSGVFKRLHLRSGATLWSRDVGSRIEAMACLLGCETVVFGTLDGSLFALAIDTGTNLWCLETGGAIKAPPTWIPKAGILLVGSHGRSVFAVREEGTQLWRKQLDGTPIVAPIAVVEDHTALVGTLGGSLHCLNIKTGEIFNYFIHSLK